MASGKNIQLVIPLSEKDYKKGFGEHINAEIVNALFSCEEGSEVTFYAQLKQDSIFYNSLYNGQIVEVEMTEQENTYIIPYSNIEESETLIDILKSEKEEQKQVSTFEQQIEYLKDQMVRLAKKHGRNDSKVIDTSQQLDQLLNIYLNTSKTG